MGGQRPPHTPLFSRIHLTHNATSGILVTFDRALVISRLRDLLYKAGIFDDDAQLLGQWKPDTYKRYIEVHLEYTGIHNVSLRLQTFSRHDDTTPKTTPRPAHSWPPTGTPPPTSSGRHIGEWGVRAGARESPGRPLGRPPSQGPPRVVPDEASAP